MIHFTVRLLQMLFTMALQMTLQWWHYTKHGLCFSQPSSGAGAGAAKSTNMNSQHSVHWAALIHSPWLPGLCLKPACVVSPRSPGNVVTQKRTGSRAPLSDSSLVLGSSFIISKETWTKAALAAPVNIKHYREVTKSPVIHTSPLAATSSCKSSVQYPDASLTVWIQTGTNATDNRIQISKYICSN